jgi:regulator of replication initiation timing
MENIPEYLKWIAGFAVTVLTTLGAAKLIENRQSRRYQIEDKNRDIHESNQGRQIDLDQAAFNAFAKRLETLEADVKDLNAKLAAAMEKSARLEVENKHLKETNERPEGEITNMRTRETILNQQVNSLTAIVVKLQMQIDNLQKA